MDKRSSEADPYEKVLINLMWLEKMTLCEAIHYDMLQHNIDFEDIYEATDFLENRFENLDKVLYYMMVITGQEPDVILVENYDGKYSKG